MMLSDENREDRRVRRTKRMLKRAFIDILYEKEYKDISVTDIVERADYNRSTFYFHYKYKEELVEELNESMVNGLIAAFFDDFKKGIENMTPADIVIFEHIYKKKDFFNLWKTSEAIPNIQEMFIDKFSLAFKKELLKMRNLNIDIDMDLYVTYHAQGVLGLILDWIKKDYSHSSTYMSRQLHNLLNINQLKRS
ncbi:hypothetical protein CHH80_11975 [Bacillus sp. 7504-2]|nr:hypothetical protein CHH80_11975 [Bacillus sp. 7504-2]